MGRKHRTGYQYIKRAVLRRDGRQCRDCGSKPDIGKCNKLNIHHIVPKSEGGSDDTDNLITLCEECHNKRHSNPHKRFPEEEDPPDKIPEENVLPYECYNEGCDRRFPKESGAQSHYASEHGKRDNGLYPWQEDEIYVWFNCVWCGDLAERKQKYSKKFCSKECYDKRRKFD